MSLPATDAFTDTNGTGLSAHNANWSVKTGGFSISSNQIVGNDAVGNAAGWQGDSFNNTHYAKIQIVSGPLGQYCGVAVRVSTSVAAGYYFFASVSGGDSYVGAFSGSAFNDIGGSRGSFNASDIIELRASATGTLQAFKNSIQLGSDISDSTNAGGNAGLASYYSYNASGAADNWEGGNLGGAASVFLDWLGVRIDPVRTKFEVVSY